MSLPASKLFDLNALRVFLTLAQTGSMRKTAQQFGLSVSAVSQSISSLEKQVGVELFNHKVRPLEPSLAGRLLINEGEKLLQDVWRITYAMQASTLENIHLRIGFSESISHSLAPLICGSLYQSVKSFSVQTAMTQTLKEQLLKRELDILISPESFDEKQTFYRQPLWSETYLLVLPKNEKRITNLEQLRNMAQRLSYIRYNVDSTDRVQSERIFRKLNIEQRDTLGVEASYTMVGLVAQGLGWAIMPPLGIWQGREWTNQIQVMPIPNITIKRTQWIVTPSKGFEQIVSRIRQASLESFQSHVKPWLESSYPGIAQFVVPCADS